MDRTSIDPLVNLSKVVGCRKIIELLATKFESTELSSGMRCSERTHAQLASRSPIGNSNSAVDAVVILYVLNVRTLRNDSHCRDSTICSILVKDNLFVNLWVCW